MFRFGSIFAPQRNSNFHLNEAVWGWLKEKKCLNYLSHLIRWNRHCSFQIFFQWFSNLCFLSYAFLISKLQELYCWSWNFFYQDENPEDSWSLMLEADLVALFEQFPFEKLLKFLLRMDEAEGRLNLSFVSLKLQDMEIFFA